MKPHRSLDLESVATWLANDTSLRSYSDVRVFRDAAPGKFVAQLYDAQPGVRRLDLLGDRGPQLDQFVDRVLKINQTRDRWEMVVNLKGGGPTPPTGDPNPKQPMTFSSVSLGRFTCTGTQLATVKDLPNVYYHFAIRSAGFPSPIMFNLQPMPNLTYYYLTATGLQPYDAASLFDGNLVSDLWVQDNNLPSLGGAASPQDQITVNCKATTHGSVSFLFGAIADGIYETPQEQTFTF